MDRADVIRMAEEAGFSITAGIVQGIGENLHILIALARQGYIPTKEWMPLTDKEIQEKRHLIDWTAGWSYNTFARSIEQALREKNT